MAAGVAKGLGGAYGARLSLGKNGAGRAGPPGEGRARF